MCPAFLCCLTRRTDLATGPDEIRVSATNQLNAIMNRLSGNGIVRSAVTLRVWLSVIISLALLLPDLVLVNKRAITVNRTSPLTVCAGRRDRHESGGARRKGALAPSCGSCHGFPVALTLGQNCPRDTSRLVGQGHSGNAFWFAPCQLPEPLAPWSLLNPVTSQL